MGKPALVPVIKSLVVEGENSLVLRTGYLNNLGGYCYPIFFGGYESIKKMEPVHNLEQLSFFNRYISYLYISSSRS